MNLSLYEHLHEWWQENTEKYISRQIVRSHTRSPVPKLSSPRLVDGGENRAQMVHIANFTLCVWCDLAKFISLALGLEMKVGNFGLVDALIQRNLWHFFLAVLEMSVEICQL